MILMDLLTTKGRHTKLRLNMYGSWPTRQWATAHVLMILMAIKPHNPHADDSDGLIVKWSYPQEATAHMLMTFKALPPEGHKQYFDDLDGITPRGPHPTQPSLQQHTDDTSGQYVATYSIAVHSDGICCNAYCPPVLTCFARDLIVKRC